MLILGKDNTDYSYLTHEASTQTSNWFYRGGAGITLNSAGLVGIGTSSPQAKLEIAQSSDSTDGPKLRIANNGNTLSNGQLIGGIDFFDGDDSGEGVGAYIYSYTTDSIGRASGQDLRFGAGESERARIDSSGNVGIGTTSPGAKLDVAGNVRVRGSATPTLTFNDGAIENNLSITNSAFVLSVPSANPITFNTTNTERLRITDAGLVGIGTSSPGAKIHSLQASTGEGLRVDGADSGFSLVVEGGTTYHTKIRQGSIGSTYFSNTPPTNGLIVEGSVGIGTSSPAARLDIRGSAPYMYIVDSGANSAAFVAEATNSVVNVGSTYLGTSAVPLALVTGGTERLRITSAGLVGIGTTSPAPGGQGVHIHNPSAAASSLRVTNSTTGATDGDGFAIQVGSDGTAQLRQFESLALTFETAATERARIDSSGRLGIGTSSPGAKLDVTGGDLFVTPNTAGKNTITLTTNAVDDGRILIKSNTTTKVDIQANGTSYFDGGNVGIGSTAPQYPLHVETTGTGTAAGDNTSIIVQSQASGRDCNIRFGDSINASARIGYLSNNLYFYVNGNERARIDSSGKLLVGTSSARSTVKVDATSGNAPIIQLEGSNNGYSTSLSITNFNVNSYGPALALNASKGSQATPAAVSSGGDLGFLTFNGYDGTNFIPGAHITAFVDGTPGANDMPGRLVFSTTADGASTPTERLRIDSSGRVGIGTVSPTRLLTVQSTGNANLCIKTTNTGVSQCMFGDTDSDVAGNIAYLHSADAMTFETLGTERARIDSSGRLLVGTSTWSGDERVVIYNNPSSSGPGYLGLATGTASPANGINLGAVIYAASDGGNIAAIRVKRDGGSWTNGTSTPTRLEFSTTADGTSAPTERMRIASSGGFKVSNTGAYNLGSDIHEINHNVVGSAAFHVYHSAASTPYGYYFKFTGANPNDATSYVFGSFDNVNANIYTIYSNGTVSARSDAKFKKNIETTRNGYLEDLAQLRVVKYNWYNHDDDTPKELGFIAQEVEQVFPGLVSTVPDKDDQGNETGEVSKSIKTSVFTPMLVKALQEALERIETLEAEVAALKAQ
jgi:hypothetical protein